MSEPMESGRLETRLGPLGWQSSGQGPSLVFFAGAFANRDLWRDVVTLLKDCYRCITIDLPGGSSLAVARESGPVGPLTGPAAARLR
jgi:pimeloyl-ACP methyl ester carboxylesterase